MAYLSLRRMDEVVLRARLYMNRQRLFRGFLFLAIGMVAIMAVALAGAVALAADTTLPSAASYAGLIVSFGAIGVACYYFYALARPPPAGHRPAPGAE